RRHTRSKRDWSSDVCSSDLGEMVYKRADAGEAHYVRVLEDTGDIMGIALTNLIHIMNPEKIVLGGGVMNAKKFLLPHIKETIANQALTADAKQTAIAVSELGDDATLLGAVSLFLVEEIGRAHV